MKKQEMKSNRKRVNGRGGASPPMHYLKAVEAAPGPEKAGSLPTRLADHTLLLRWHRYSEARDLRWIKYDCCSNIV